MPRVYWFEIHAESPERAIRFYEGAFGWRFTKWDGPVDYWLASTGDPGVPGIDGAIVRRMGGAPASGQPVNAFVCTLEVPTLDVFVENALRHGGSIAVPKMTVPGTGHLAYVKDTEGNILGLMQADPSAK